MIRLKVYMEKENDTNSGDDCCSDFMSRSFRDSQNFHKQSRDKFNEFIKSNNRFNKINENIIKLDCFTGITRLYFVFYSNYILTAFALVSSGQLTQTYSILRLCLETVMYGIGFEKGSQDDRNSLLQRSENKKKCSNYYRISNLKRFLRESERDRLIKMYDKTIEFGAHPNIRQIANNLGDFADGFIKCGNKMEGREFSECINDTIEVGNLCLDIIEWLVCNSDCYCDSLS